MRERQVTHKQAHRGADKPLQLAAKRVSRRTSKQFHLAAVPGRVVLLVILYFIDPALATSRSPLIFSRFALARNLSTMSRMMFRMEPLISLISRYLQTFSMKMRGYGGPGPGMEAVSRCGLGNMGMAGPAGARLRCY